MITNTKTAPVVQEKDRNAVSLDLMNRMKLHGMAAAFSEILTSTVAESMTPDGFLSWLLAREWDYRSAAAFQRLIKNASFRYDAFVEQVDYTIGTRIAPEPDGEACLTRIYPSGTESVYYRTFWNRQELYSYSIGI
jgi:hypothetical protein